ncbi:hypothetical protein QPK87_04535 [Kamptonema cortianum]|nr:hypothetical protein [Kamptonema cortianum]
MEVDLHKVESKIDYERLKQVGNSLWASCNVDNVDFLLNEYELSRSDIDPLLEVVERVFTRLCQGESIRTIYFLAGFEKLCFFKIESISGQYFGSVVGDISPYVWPISHNDQPGEVMVQYIQTVNEFIRNGSSPTFCLMTSDGLTNLESDAELLILLENRLAFIMETLLTPAGDDIDDCQ